MLFRSIGGGLMSPTLSGTSPQEAQFLSGLIGNFTSAIMNFVRETFPNAKFEMLYPSPSCFLLWTSFA